MIKKCCVCKRIKSEGKWHSGIPNQEGMKITHAYCPACFNRTMAKINKYHVSYKSKNVPRSELDTFLLGI